MPVRIAAACALSLAVLALPASADSAIEQIAGPGSGDGQFNAPTSIALNSAGELVVGDAGNGRIQKLTTTGQPVAHFDVRHGDSSYDPRLYAAVGGGDDIYEAFVPPPDGGAVYRYSTNGAQLGAWGSMWEPAPNSLYRVAGVAVDGAGEVFVAAEDSSGAGQAYRVVRYSATGAYIGAWQVRDGNGLPRAAQAVAARGNVIAVLLGPSGSDPAEMVRYDPQGTVLSRWTGGPASDYGGPLAQVRGIAIAPTGDLFTAGGSFIREYSAAGDLLSSYTDAPYYFDGSQNDFQNRCLPRGTDPTGSWSSGSFTGVTVDAAGDVYATDSTRNSVFRLNGKPDAVLWWGPRSFGPGPYAGEVISLDASHSSLPFGSVTKFEWDLDGNGTFETDTGANPRAATGFAITGTHDVSVRVTGSRGLAAVATEHIPVIEPHVSLGWAGITLTGRTIRFTAWQDPTHCGKSVYEWDLDGDGTFETKTGTEATAPTVYDKPGKLIVRVRILGAGGRVDEASMPVNVRLAPPRGPVGVSINDGAQYTNDPAVTVYSIWPKFTDRMVVANDGGFRQSQSFPITQLQPWRLESSGPERLPKTVYVRFEGDGVGSDVTYTDDIILDETKPVLTEANILGDESDPGADAAQRRSVRLHVSAHDNLSGVSRMQLALHRRHPRRWTRMRRVSRVRTGADALWVRVRDRAGNRSRWRLAR